MKMRRSRKVVKSAVSVTADKIAHMHIAQCTFDTSLACECAEASVSYKGSEVGLWFLSK